MSHVALKTIFPPASGPDSPKCWASAEEVLSAMRPAKVHRGVKSFSTSTTRHFVTVLKLFYQKELLFSWHLLHVSLSLLCRLFLPSFCNMRKFDPRVMVTNPFEPCHCSFSYHRQPSVELQLSIIWLLFSYVLWHMGLKAQVYITAKRHRTWLSH